MAETDLTVPNQIWSVGEWLRWKLADSGRMMFIWVSEKAAFWTMVHLSPWGWWVLQNPCGGRRRMWSNGQTITKDPKLSGMHRVKNSRCANLERYVPDQNLMHLIFNGKPNGIRPPAHRPRRWGRGRYITSSYVPLFESHTTHQEPSSRDSPTSRGRVPYLRIVFPLRGRYLGMFVVQSRWDDVMNLKSIPIICIHT